VERIRKLAPIALLGFLLAACSSASSSSTQASTAAPSTISTKPASSSSQPADVSNKSPVAPQKPVPPETNPPGDIPDSTAFVAYRSKTGGFAVKVPEGWSRHERASSVAFTDKLNTIDMSWTPATTAPTVATAKKNEVPVLQNTDLAFRLQSVKQVSLPGGKAVLLTYQMNSPPNGVTGKQYRLDVLRYEYFGKGKEIALTLSSPVGADNVDPWNTVSQSLKPA
jgi:hypothetical protein